MFFVFLQKHSFSPENGLFCSFLSASLFFSSVSFTSPFSFSVSLSLSLSFLFFVFFPSLFSCFFVLPCFCCYCLPCFFAFVSRKTQHQILHLKGFFSFFLFFLGGGGAGVLFCFVLQILFYFWFFVLSVVCFCQHKCFHFSKKTISKTPSFVLCIVQSYRFFKGRF